MDKDVQQHQTSRWRVFGELEFWLLLSLACAIYLPRLTQLTIRGEESRRAQVAAEILRTGDWIVPRQQGEVYLSRPPLGSWPIAVLAILRGDLDAFSVRFPSAVTTIGTCVLIYVYARGWLRPIGALSAGVAYGSMAQVLELGGLAETESTLTWLVAASLLLWHAGYATGCRARWPWLLGYALAALAGLAKGPQGPVYFVAVTTIYLWMQRDFREWLSWRHAAGLLTFGAVLGAWQIPFTMQTDWPSTLGIWFNNASDRFADSSWQPLLRHLASYPFEVAACMLPWSLILIAYLYPGLRRRLDHTAPLVRFLFTAVLVTFPSCWLAATARGRYFMPLYPCFAVLVGAAVDRIVALAREEQLGYALQRFFWPFAVILPGAGVAFVVLGSFDVRGSINWRATADFPTMSVALTIVALLGGWLTARAARDVTPSRVRWAMLSIAAFLGFVYMGPITNVRIAESENTEQQVASLKEQLPADAWDELVSVGRIHHLFAYHFREPIRSIASPDSLLENSDWEYFCFNQPGESPPDLPFAWSAIAVVSCERNRTPYPVEKVVVARRLKEESQTAGRGDERERK